MAKRAFANGTGDSAAGKYMRSAYSDGTPPKALLESLHWHHQWLNTHGVRGTQISPENNPFGDGRVIYGMDFGGVDFTAADLRGCVFRGCDFLQANFARANLANAVFDNCLLKFAIFDTAIMDGMKMNSDFSEAICSFPTFGHYLDLGVLPCRRMRGPLL